jgi:putative transcriptional regulator
MVLGPTAVLRCGSCPYDTQVTTKGRLLVATPTLLDPNFFRTVVLMLEHADEGALGVVLNRPSELEIAESLPAWRDVAVDPAMVFVGGPVAPGSAIGIARGRGDTDSDAWAPVVNGLGTVDLSLSPADLPVDVTALRVFAGYAGWTAGQLDAELAAEGWFVVDAEPDDAFAPEPEELWKAVLRRQGGTLALFANAPPHPSLN